MSRNSNNNKKVRYGSLTYGTLLDILIGDALVLSKHILEQGKPKTICKIKFMFGTPSY
jgi:hypothetical protein